MPALAFYIDAPMQAWGLSSRFQHRETNAFPTKSALVGMVAAAMGINKHDADEYKHTAGSDVTACFHVYKKLAHLGFA